MRDRLGVVLRVRTIQEQLASAALARAVDEVRHTAEEHDRRAGRHARRPSGGTGLSSADLTALRVAGIGTGAALADARRAHEHAAAHHEQAVVDHRGRLVQRRAAERMVDRRAAIARQEADRAAQRLLDDVAVLRWRRP